MRKVVSSHEPGACADDDGGSDVAQEEVPEMPSRGAERHANADLAGAL